MRWGQWDWPLLISTPERAILELIDELPNKETFHLVDVTMEGLVNVSPRRMQQLLEVATSIKVKAANSIPNIKSRCRGTSMPFNDVYRRQVDLLVRTLPYVAEEECFALKGGT